ncbi:MAG: sporulation-delaying protein SdpB family protein [Leucobacter sp.]
MPNRRQAPPNRFPSARPLLLFRQWPFTLEFGVARTLLALSSLLTLLFNDPSDVFALTEESYAENVCQVGWSLFCLTDGATAKWLAVVVLVAVISGFLPQLTAIPHWWVTFSFYHSAIVTEGGDQLAAILTLLIIPIALVDPRFNHWQEPFTPDRGFAVPRQLVGGVFLLAIKLQFVVVYFQAGVSKLATEEWANGTAMFYWLTHPLFGAPEWLQPALAILTHSPFWVTAMTWLIPIFEVLLASAVLLPAPFRRVALYVLVTFHLGIALVMGIWSFSITMIALGILALDVPLRRTAGVSDPTQQTP